MSDESKQQPDVADIEDALATLVPLASQLDPDVLMFRAGQVAHHAPETIRAAAIHPARWWSRRGFWPAVAAAMTLLAVTLGAYLVRHLQSDRALEHNLANHPGHEIDESPIIVGGPADSLPADGVVRYVVVPGSFGGGTSSIPAAAVQRVRNSQPIDRAPGQFKSIERPLLLGQPSGKPIYVIIVVPDQTQSKQRP